MRQGSAPNYCPPVTEGETISFLDEEGEKIELEFLGIIIHDDRQYGFFYPLERDGAEGSGELILLEVTAFDEENQPLEFELVTDEGIAQEVYADFREATKDIYSFE